MGLVGALQLPCHAVIPPMLPRQGGGGPASVGVIDHRQRRWTDYDHHSCHSGQGEMTFGRDWSSVGEGCCSFPYKVRVELQRGAMTLFHLVTATAVRPAIVSAPSELCERLKGWTGQVITTLWTSLQTVQSSSTNGLTPDQVPGLAPIEWSGRF